MRISRATAQALGLGVVVLAAYVARVAYFADYINDDAYITFRYSRNLAAGVGPYYNPGEHVEGYTNFLLMLALAGVERLFHPADLALTAKALNVAGALLALCSAWVLTARWLRPLPGMDRAAAHVAWLAPVLVVANAAYALNSVSGLETALFSGLLLGGLALLQSGTHARRWHGAGMLFALAALTRPEGAGAFACVLAAALLAGGWRDRVLRRLLLTDAAIVGAVILAHTVFRYCAYGALLQNTYYAKTGGFGGVAPAQYVWDFAALHLGGPVALAPLLVLLTPNRPLLREMAPALALCLFGAAAPFLAGTDWMIGYRLLVPYAPAWAALAIAGVAIAAVRLRRGAAVSALGGVAAIAAVLVMQGNAAAVFRFVCDENYIGYTKGHRALAAWLNETAQPGDLVALMDIGQVGYFCPQLEILDISGLTDRHIARSPGPLFDKQYDPAYVFDRQPRYIVLVLTILPREPEQGLLTWTRPEGRLREHPAFQRNYRRVREPVADDPYEVAAAREGAVRVFHHDVKRMLYLLAVFERAAPPAG